MNDAGWVLVTCGPSERTDYLPVPGGRLYRTVIWPNGLSMAGSTASVCFVPELIIEGSDARTPTEILAEVFGGDR